MTGKTAEPDDDSIFFAICDIEHIAKQVIRAARPASRHPMWKEYLGTMQAAAEASEDLMPWEDPEEVTRITARQAKAVLLAVLEAAPDPAERDRLAKVTAKEAERVEKRMEKDGSAADSLPAGKHPLRHCGQCGRKYRPKRATSVYCSANCRTQAYKQRQAARVASTVIPEAPEPGSPGTR